MSKSKAVAKERINKALKIIEEAQTKLGQAGSEIASIRGLGSHCNALGKLYQDIKTEWYALEKFTSGKEFDLDDLNKSKLKD